jgi:hypothetical protein
MEVTVDQIFSSGFNGINNMIFDNTGFPNGYLYLVDNSNYIYKVDVNGNVSVFFSNLNIHNFGIVFDSANNFYYCSPPDSIYIIDPSGNQSLFIQDSVNLTNPSSLQIDSNNILYVCNNQYISQYGLDGSSINLTFLTAPTNCYWINLIFDIYGNFYAIYGTGSINQLNKYDPNGNLLGNIYTDSTNSMISLGFDNSNNLYFTNNYSNVITLFTSLGSASFTGPDNYLQVSNDILPFTANTSTFTIEAWVYLTQSPNETNIDGVGILSGFFGDGDNTNQTTNFRFGPVNNQTLALWWNDGILFNNCIGSIVIPLNSWHHIVLSVLNDSITMFVDGIQDLSLNGVTTLTSRGSLFNYFFIGEFVYIGGYDSAYIYGYISNFRFVNEVAVYTGNFTVPTIPLTATQTASTNISAITDVTSTCLLLNFNDNSTFLTDSSSYQLTINTINYITNSVNNPFYTL